MGTDLELHFWEEGQVCILGTKEQTILSIYCFDNLALFPPFFFLGNESYLIPQCVVQVGVATLSHMTFLLV